MKRAPVAESLLAAAMLALASCAPQAFVVRPEMRGPSKSGLNLAGKSMAVVYLTDNGSGDGSFNASVASGFASRLEEDYFGGKQLIELFTMEAVPGADYSAKDSLVNLVMESGRDVVFVFDVPVLGEPIVGDPLKVVGTKAPLDSSYVYNVAMPFATKVYVYDSMDKADKVLAFSGNKSLATEVYSDGKASKGALAHASLKDFSRLAEQAGSLAANTFLSSWAQDDFYVIYYDGAEKAWNRAAEHAYAFRWKEAIEQWMTLVKAKSPEKRACASYNIAVGCFLSGQPDLALEWLDRSDKETPISLSKPLRAKIKKYAGR